MIVTTQVFGKLICSSAVKIVRSSVMNTGVPGAVVLAVLPERQVAVAVDGRLDIVKPTDGYTLQPML